LFDLWTSLTVSHGRQTQLGLKRRVNDRTKINAE